MIKKKHLLSIRSSAAEYLTFVAATGDTPQSIEMRYEDENIWLTQKMLATLYDVEIPTINYHLKKIFEDSELEKNATIRKFLIVQNEGNRKIERETEHYNLQMIIAVGFKVNSARAVQFRKWVNKIAKDYTIQGWVMDKERLIQGGSVLTNEYFDYLLQEIREIRLSERKFYQKITDIYATALELIYKRADSKKKNMGLTTWKNSPKGKILKTDVSIAKNYLTKDELEELGRIVNAYLDLAEVKAKRKIPMTMEDWAKQLNSFLSIASDRSILQNAGEISHKIACDFAESEWEKYRVVQDQLYKSDFDKLLEETNKRIKR